MCQVSRRGFLAGAAAGVAATAHGRAAQAPGKETPAKEALAQRELARGVHFAEGDTFGVGFSNSGWVVLEDYVLVVDANYPGAARELVRRIRAVTQKPIRFAFDTHHHGDHLYGNGVYHEHGATAVASAAALAELRRVETGRYGTGGEGSWEAQAKGREDVRGASFKPPTLVFPRDLRFDDGRTTVELLHLGVAHTKGDAFAWLPQEGILFTGDAVVNGPYNYVGDGVVESWIRTLDEARKLGARVVCPGHGAFGDASLLEDQQAFFKALWDRVGTRLAKLAPEEARAAVEPLRRELRADRRLARFTSDAGYTPMPGWDIFPSQVAKVYQEITGRVLASAGRPDRLARAHHARAHGAA